MKILSSIIDNKDISTKEYLDGKVKTNVPENAVFTDTVYAHPATHDLSMITDNSSDNVFDAAHKMHGLLYFKNNTVTDISQIYKSGFYGTKNTDTTTPYRAYWFVAVFCKDEVNQIAVQWAMDVGKLHNGELWMRTVRLNASTTADGNYIGEWKKFANADNVSELMFQHFQSAGYTGTHEEWDASLLSLVTNDTSTASSRSTISVTADNTSVIDIPINISDTNSLTVYYNGLLLTPTSHYTATTSSITLVGYTANVGDLFTFVGYDTASTSQNIAAAQVLFSNPVQYGSCATVYEALEHIAYKLDTVAMLASESGFRALVNSKVHEYNFDYFCIETLEDTTDINTSADDGASLITNYYDSDRHVINKTSADTLTVRSTVFSIDTIPYDAWVYIDYDGTGSISLSISKNGGSTWIDINNDTLTELNALVQKSIVVKTTIVGAVRIKNIAWGVK